MSEKPILGRTENAENFVSYVQAKYKGPHPKLFKEDDNMLTIAQQLEQRGRQAGLEEGLERGIEKGIEKGRQEGTYRTLRSFIEQRFGSLSEKQIAYLSGLSEEALQALINRVLKARSLKELIPVKKRSKSIELC